MAPTVLAVVLGNGTENAFRQAMLMSNGDLGIFYSNPIVSTVMTIGIVLALLPFVTGLYNRFVVSKRMTAESGA
ncbi:MAG TPA: hypothetical protein VKY38_01185, partial [Azoarcus sp.]|nr:hypothetical protein [Azoarcus sp.]